MKNQGVYLLEIELNQKKIGSRFIYDEIYTHTDLSQIRSFYLWLVRQMNLPGNGRLLDIACGSGDVINLIQNLGVTGFGVDLSFTVAQQAVRNNINSRNITVSEGESLPFPSQFFDYVTNIGSLEHFVDPVQGVLEMARILKRDGKAFVLVPNTFSLLTNIWIAYKTGQLSVDQQPIQRYGTKSDWKRLLESNGLIVDNIIKYERPWPYYFPDWKYYLSKPKELARLVLSPLVPLNLAFCFLFICHKA
jgi:ubiquinone/menaquinone biosynthesis C-methylase UbiE